MGKFNRVSSLLTTAFVLLTAGVFNPQPLPAQSITPADDDTGTLINHPDGTTFEITGGTLSGDGTNLFHSFEQFGLDANQVANFLSQPQIRNILGRVMGGDPSVINGLIQVTGGNSNLFLMNPAGLLFGSGASLNVPADFTATTANGIGFAGGWFNAVGANNYPALNGAPNSFAFTMKRPGSIINNGSLRVGNGQNFSLIGGNVINTGTIAAPGGNITIAAVPGENLVRISQAGMILNLEIVAIENISDPSLPTKAGISPLDLALLLTGGGDTKLAINPDGSIQVVGTNTVITNQAGTFIAAGNLDTRAHANGGAVTLNAIAGDIITGNIDSSSLGGGNGGKIALHAGGTIDTTGGLLQSASLGDVGGDVTLDAEGEIRTGTINSNSFSRNSGSIASTESGNGGDVILEANGDILTDQISTNSQNSGSGGDVIINAGGTIDATDSVVVSSAADGDAGDIILTAGGEIQADASVVVSATESGDSGDITMTANGGVTVGTIASQSQDSGDSGDVTVNSGGEIEIAAIESSAGAGNSGDVNLIATGDITTGTISTTAEGAANSVTDTMEIPATTTTGQIDHISFEDNSNSTDQTSVASTPEVNTDSVSVEGNDSGDIVATSTEGGITTEDSSQTSVASSPGVNTDAVSVEGNDSGDIPVTSTEGGISAEDSPQTVVGSSPDSSAGTIELPSSTGTGKIHNISFEDNFNIGQAADPSADLTPVAISPEVDTPASDLTPVAITPEVDTPASDLIPVAITPEVDTPASDLTSVAITPEVDTTDAVLVEGNDSGNVAITSLEGDIKAEVIQTTSILGDAGDVNLTANGNIETGNIISQAGENSGDINLSSTTGTITTQDITSAAELGRGGTITVSAQSDINTGAITTKGGMGSGDIYLNSIAGRINTDALHTDTGGIFRNGVLINPVGGSLSVSSVLTNPNQAVAELEQSRIQAFEAYFGKDLSAQSVSADSIRMTLTDIEQQTGDRSAVIYANISQDQSQLEDTLKLVVIMPTGEPINVTVPEVTRSQLVATINDFRTKIATSYRRGNDSYLPVAQQLYQWLIAPIESQLAGEKINTLLFAMDTGLRTLPIAALHDGQQFLVEKYSLGMVPSFGLINPTYKSLANAQTLAMGATTFSDLDPLPAVSAELAAINQMWPGLVFLNQDFNRFNLVESRQGQRYPIVHLATHAQFNPGAVENSYIQLWQDKLRLSEMGQLGWKDAAVELLTLSACSTAVGNEDAEMGFAGLTVATGVKSALASLWSVSDEGTFALMSAFYHQLQSAQVKSEALRQAQLAMIHGQLQIEAGELRGAGIPDHISLPPELGAITNHNLSHPYYWSGFTMIGSPW